MSRIKAVCDTPLDIFLVRKLGMPGHPEYAMGAIASGGVRVISDEVVRWYGISDRGRPMIKSMSCSKDMRDRANASRAAAITQNGGRMRNGIAAGTRQQAHAPRPPHDPVLL